MRALLQRAARAAVEVDGETIAKIGRGLVVLAAAGPDDGIGDVELLARKIVHLRIFADEQGRFNRSLLDVGGQALVVSQFTLFADCRKGRRPSFAGAAPSAEAEGWIASLCRAIRDLGAPTETGRFGAMMQVQLVNDGPVTIWLDSKELRP